MKIIKLLRVKFVSLVFTWKSFQQIIKNKLKYKNILISCKRNLTLHTYKALLVPNDPEKFNPNLSIS